MGDVEDPRPEVRIGDRERREVDARLQQAYADGVLTMTEYEERAAQCWAARTRSELDPLLADLPDPEPASEPATEVVPTTKAAAPAAPAPVSGLRRVAGGLVSLVLVGAGLYAGSQVVTAEDGFSMFGGRTLTVGATDDRVEVGFMFGGTRIVVPADATVRTEGMVLFGGTSCRAACDGTGTARGGRQRCRGVRRSEHRPRGRADRGRRQGRQR